MENRTIKVFSQENCATCEGLITLLTKMNINYQLLNCTTDFQAFKDNAITVSPTTIIYDNDIEIGRFYGLKKESYIKDIFT